MAAREVPLFPLRTVLFPEGPLPLRIFETRYLDMVSRCLREDCPFGVVLLLQGAETGAARMAEVGTLARIGDWYQGSDGLLGITAAGGERFRVGSVRRQADGLYLGTIEALPEPPPAALPAEYEPMARLLEGVVDDLGKLYEGLPRRFGDAGWVGCRLAEILPIPVEVRQQCLECAGPLERLDLLKPLLKRVRWETSQ